MVQGGINVKYDPAYSTYIHIYMHASVHARMHARTHARTHAHTHTYIHGHMVLGEDRDLIFHGETSTRKLVRRGSNPGPLDYRQQRYFRATVEVYK